MRRRQILLLDFHGGLPHDHLPRDGIAFPRRRHRIGRSANSDKIQHHLFSLALHIPFSRHLPQSRLVFPCCRDAAPAGNCSGLLEHISKSCPPNRVQACPGEPGSGTLPPETYRVPTLFDTVQSLHWASSRLEPDHVMLYGDPAQSQLVALRSRKSTPTISYLYELQFYPEYLSPFPGIPYFLLMPDRTRLRGRIVVDVSLPSDPTHHDINP